MRNHDKTADNARRMAIKELTRVSDKIRDKEQSKLRMYQNIQKVERELKELNQVFEKSLTTIQGITMTTTQNVCNTNEEKKL